MENKLHETGIIVRIETATAKPQGMFLDMVGEREPMQSGDGLNWTYPTASERLVRQLMVIANTQEEYELLAQDLQELQALCPTCSNLLKGGAAHSAGIIR